MRLTDALGWPCSGYYHFLIAPEYRTYFGIKLCGEYYVMTALPFGWAPACKLFSDTMGEVYRVLRLVGGLSMTYLIDDMLVAAGTHLGRAMVQSRAVAVLLAALGMHWGISKCQFLPQPQAGFLGMRVETDWLDEGGDGQRHCRFVIPPAKRERPIAALDQVRGTIRSGKEERESGKA